MSTQDEESLVFHDPEAVEGPEDVSFPNFAHHLQVRAELTELVSMGVLDEDEGDAIYEDWKEQRNE